jgi:septum site-determining protein MinC
MAQVMEQIDISQETINTTIIMLTTTRPKNIEEMLPLMNTSNRVKFTILDMASISSMESPAWFRNIRSAMKQYNLILIGVRNPQLNLEVCKSLRIPIIDASSSREKPLIQTKENQYLDKHVRSGQQVYSQQGSLIVNGNVSAGSELASSGNIHIYGSCNGKVLAGVTGNTSARIYLNAGYPELISIAGITLHSEQLSPISSGAIFKICNGQLSQHPLY